VSKATGDFFGIAVTEVDEYMWRLDCIDSIIECLRRTERGFRHVDGLVYGASDAIMWRRRSGFILGMIKLTMLPQIWERFYQLPG